ncbi:hypothetical protein F5050DRAFT_1812411 [Lentinula boryana]|uniref:DUF6532 domain-containing protein n=1 Tax=Lentinula boryana TaxID=40481 RepID=A0ABQ8PZ77_9AGAR|nr:hypothetical protein F5050DRAFT_1812411 [Lentinula boryana]
MRPDLEEISSANASIKTQSDVNDTKDVQNVRGGDASDEHENDSDDEELKRLEEQISRHKAQKAKKLALRNDIMAFRANEPLSITKRSRSNTSDQTSVENYTVVKRNKVEVGGLRPDWKSKVSSQANVSHSSTPSRNREDNDIEFELGGEFGKEGVEKGTDDGPIGSGNEDDIVQVKLEASDANLILKEECETGKPAKSPKSSHVRVSDLPLILSSDQEVWKSAIRSSLIEWSATCAKQFHINSNPKFRPVVQELWNVHLGSLPHMPLECEYKGGKIKRSEHPSVVAFAAADIRNYRSHFAKVALRVVQEYLEENGITMEGRRNVVEELLHHEAFVYEKLGPTRQTSSGAFRGILLMRTFAFYLTWAFAVPNASKSNTHPMGALSLATTAVLRALDVFKSGSNAMTDTNNAKKKKPASSPDNFNDKWASQQAKFHNSISQLNDDKWALILRASEAHISGIPNAGAGPFLKHVLQVEGIKTNFQGMQEGNVAAAGDDEIMVSD